MSLENSELSNHEWNGFENVVEALNVPDSLWRPGEKFYFEGRAATEEEKIYMITADGDESAKPVIFLTSISHDSCPAGEM